MIDQIILSTNEDPTYMDFWKPVAFAYSRMFPEAKVHLAFLTNREEDDPLVEDFRKSGMVTLFKPIPDMQEFSQAKMIRFILAARQGYDVCYIDDIDLFPLVKSFITSKTDQRPAGHLLCVGGEVYNHNGCYPVSQMTAEGVVFKQFINPNYLPYKQVMRSYRGRTLFDRRENPDIELDFAKDSYFSDERLIRRLISKAPVPKFEVERGYKNFLEATLDRYKWEVNMEKLKNHGYVNAHGVRPYSKNVEEYVPLLQYIEENYPAKA